MEEDLLDATECISAGSDCDVVVDCSQIDRVGCCSCRQLLELDDALRANGHRLLLCGSQAKLGKAFASPVPPHLLRCATDRFSALARLGLPSA
jgi:anti-anti-sigma regulatory factor